MLDNYELDDLRRTQGETFDRVFEVASPVGSRTRLNEVTPGFGAPRQVAGRMDSLSTSERMALAGRYGAKAMHAIVVAWDSVVAVGDRITLNPGHAPLRYATVEEAPSTADVSDLVARRLVCSEGQ